VWKQLIHKFMTIGLAASMLLIPLSCRTASAPQVEMSKTYNNWSWGVSVAYPSTWHYLEGTMNHPHLSVIIRLMASLGVAYEVALHAEQVTFASSQGALEFPGSRGAVFTMGHMPRVQMGMEWASEGIEPTGLGDVTVESQGPREIGGYEAWEAFFEMEDSAGVRVKGYMAIVAHRDNTVFLQALTPLDSWERYYPVFRSMVESISLE
jgi:hypothetical protein